MCVRSLIGLCLFFCLVNQRRKGDAQIISHLMMKLCIQINQCIKPIAIDYNYVCMFHRFQYAVFFSTFIRSFLHSLFRSVHTENNHGKMVRRNVTDEEK